MSDNQDESEKSFEPTPEKLRKAREKGEVARSTDLSVAAAYAGLLLAALGAGSYSMKTTGSALVAMIDRSESMAELVFGGAPSAALAGPIRTVSVAILPWFAIPAALVLVSIVAQRALVFAPSKLQPKMSRISIIANAKNKFGRNGWFEFGKSFAKLLLYSICLGFFLQSKLPDIIGSVAGHGRGVAAMIGRTCVEFLILALLIATAIGAVDAIWQHFEYLRKHRMSRKEIMDESKDAEGDPHMKQQRRARGQEIANSKMIAEVPTADVIIVNPTHFAVALRWSRAKGSAPVCVAKGVDEIAGTIRRIGQEAGVPIHSGPPTARAIHASVEVGDEISEELYAPVAAAIRFAEDMRVRAKGRVGS